jgi:hypothetical protein
LGNNLVFFQLQKNLFSESATLSFSLTRIEINYTVKPVWIFFSQRNNKKAYVVGRGRNDKDSFHLFISGSLPVSQ